MSAGRWRVLWAYAVADGVPRRAFWVMLVVGTILNLINQGDALFTGGRVSVAKILLTYAVPYCVATYGAVSFRVHAARSNAAASPAAASCAMRPQRSPRGGPGSIG